MSSGTYGMILAIEDDPKIAEVMRAWLEREGYSFRSVPDGVEGINAVQRLRPDLVLLDIMLPGMDGLTVCQEIRKYSPVPILIVSAKGSDLDKIIGLEIGADDYLAKPFHPKELVARVRALLRRRRWDQEVSVENRKDKNPQDTIIESRGLRLDLGRRQATLYGHELALTTLEFNLISALMRAEGRVLTRQQLLDQVWGEDYFGDERIVDTHIRNIRKKFKKIDTGYQPIEAVRGVGYRWSGEG